MAKSQPVPSLHISMAILPLESVTRKGWLGGKYIQVGAFWTVMGSLYVFWALLGRMFKDNVGALTQLLCCNPSSEEGFVSLLRQKVDERWQHYHQIYGEQPDSLSFLLIATEYAKVGVVRPHGNIGSIDDFNRMGDIAQKKINMQNDDVWNLVEMVALEAVGFGLAYPELTWELASRELHPRDLEDEEEKDFFRHTGIISPEGFATYSAQQAEYDVLDLVKGYVQQFRPGLAGILEFLSKGEQDALGRTDENLGAQLTDDDELEAKEYPGGEFLDAILNTTCKLLGDQPIDDLYKACLLGGDTGARLMLAHNSRCLHLWQKGDLQKATRLLEVWASTCVLIFLQHAKNQNAVLHDTARGFAVLFDSDPQNIETELLAYIEARKAEQARRGEIGWAFSSDILYLRTLRALGDKGVPDFELLPVPWGSFREVLEAKPDLPLDITIFTNVADWLCVPDILKSSLDVAQDTLDQAKS